MKVYRYEHRGDGLGPYVLHTPERERNRTLCDLSDKIRARHNLRSYSTHPGPWQDGFACVDWNHWHFGMSTRKLLTLWFWGFGKALRETGFVVRVYEVPEGAVKISPRTGQVIFDKRKAKPLPLPTGRAWRARPGGTK